MKLTVKPLTGPDIAPMIGDLARLRIEVFRAFPYLYEGDMAYETRYLERYATSRDALVVAAFDADRLVGAATAAPMEDHALEFAQPLRAFGYRPDRILYCGESVLLPEYRGQGIGHAFFDAREDHGRQLQRAQVAFCAVIRPNTHKGRPVNYVALDSFWRKRGYEPLEGVIAQFAWQDVGEVAETSKPMQFWMRDL